MMTGALFLILMAQAAVPAQSAPPPTTPAARPAPPQEISKTAIQAQVKASFDRTDINKDGWIDQAEAQKALEHARATQMRVWTDLVSKRFNGADVNKDGQLSRQEYESSLDKPTIPAASPWLAANDADKNGRVSLSEATALAMSAFDAADIDRNGTVTAQEARASQARQRTGGR